MVIDRAVTSVIAEGGGIRIVNEFAVHHTGWIEPVHVLPALTVVEVVLLNCVVDGWAIQLAASLLALYCEVVARRALTFLSVSARTNGIRNQIAIWNTNPSCIKSIAVQTKTHRASRSHVRWALTLQEFAVPNKTSYTRTFISRRTSPNARRIRNLGAVKLTSSGETVPAPVVSTVALVQIRLSGKCIVYDSTVYCAFSLDRIPDELLIADTSIPTDLTCSILGLKARKSFTCIISIIPSLTVGTGTCRSLCATRTGEHDVDYLNLLPDKAKHSSSQDVGSSII